MISENSGKNDVMEPANRHSSVIARAPRPKRIDPRAENLILSLVLCCDERPDATLPVPCKLGQVVSFSTNTASSITTMDCPLTRVFTINTAPVDPSLPPAWKGQS